MEEERRVNIVKYRIQWLQQQTFCGVGITRDQHDAIRQSIVCHATA